MPSQARSESVPWSPGRGIVHRVARPRFVDVAILCAVTSGLRVSPASDERQPSALFVIT